MDKKVILISFIIFIIILLIYYSSIKPSREKLISVVPDNEVNTDTHLKKYYYVFDWKNITNRFPSQIYDESLVNSINLVERQVIPDLRSGLNCIGKLFCILNPPDGHSFNITDSAVFVSAHDETSKHSIKMESRVAFDYAVSGSHKYTGGHITLPSRSEINFNGINLYYNFRRIILICNNSVGKDLIMYFTIPSINRIKAIRLKNIKKDIIVVDFIDSTPP